MSVLVIAGIGQDIAKAILEAIGAKINDFFQNADPIQALMGPLGPFFRLFITTSPTTTYANPAVIRFWTSMVIIANALLAVMVMSGGLQMMIGRTVGMLYVPPREFFGKLFAVGIAMNTSLLWGQVLIMMNNALCQLTTFTMQQLITTMTAGMTPNQRTAILFFFVLAFVLTFIWLGFHAVARILLIDVLLVSSPLWMLMWLLPQTQPYAAFGSRLLVVTVITQFLQMLAFTLGLQFLATAGVNGVLTKVILTIGMLFFIGTIPRLLSRIGMATPGGGGVMHTISSVVRVGAIFL